MRYLIVVAAAVAFTMPATHAQSQMRDCMVAGTPVPIGFNGTGTIELNSGESCNLYLNTSGEIQSSAITQRPKNGSLKMVSAANVIYTPKPGYRGSDEFAVTLKGSTQRASGTSIVKITANVR